MALQSTTPIATITLQSAATQVAFTIIPSTYRDLILVVDGSTSADFQFQTRLNGDSQTVYRYVQMYAAPTQGSDQNTLNHIRSVFGGSGYPESAILQIIDYSATNKQKTVLARENAIANSWVGARASRWQSNAAVNSITITPVSGNFTAGSTFSLYGRIA